MAEKRASTILVVDDTEASRYAVCRMLQKARFIVREAATGRQAIALITEKPDLVILDVNLPDMSGYDVCRRIKAEPTTAAIPVLHLSASFVESESRSEGLEAGADGYLVYPLEPRELIANVQVLLRIRQAERAAHAERELLRVTLGSIGDGVVATDATGVITFINAVAQGLTGWGDEALGKPLHDVFQVVEEATGLPVEIAVDSVIRGGPIASPGKHTVLMARDGTRRPIDNTAAPIRDDEGKGVGVVLVFRDVSERRQLTDELRRRSDALVEADRRKDEFLAMLAHELRNPLAPIRNTLQILKYRFAGDPEFEQSGGVMERQVTHLVRLVDDLMDVSRITRGKFELRKEWVVLGEVVARAVEGVCSFLDERQHHLEVTLPPEEVFLEADPARLEQILSNLLTNAAKYTPPGGRVWLTVLQEGGEAVIRVRDDGIGIRKEMLPCLFDLFQQGDRVPGRISEGLGIGLSLVRSLAEMHGGSVSAFSPGPGRGSEFVVRLPARSGGAPRDRKESEPRRRAVVPLRVLVTDDNVDSAESLATLLRLFGHQARTTRDGPQALEVAREFQPQVVFLDIGLPNGIDGYELARRLDRLEGLQGVLLVAMTGFGAPEDIERARLAGFNHHITKPAELEVIQSLLTFRET